MTAIILRLGCAATVDAADISYLTLSMPTMPLSRCLRSLKYLRILPTTSPRHAMVKHQLPPEASRLLPSPFTSRYSSSPPPDAILPTIHEREMMAAIRGTDAAAS